MTIYSLDVLLSNFEPVHCSTSGSNYSFLTCIQISQETSKVVWYSHLIKNFPQFIVIHTVKGLCTFPNLITTRTCDWRLDISKQLLLLTISSNDLGYPVIFITFARSDLYMIDLLLGILHSSCCEEHKFVIREWIWSSTR